MGGSLFMPRWRAIVSVASALVGLTAAFVPPTPQVSLSFLLHYDYLDRLMLALGSGLYPHNQGWSLSSPSSGIQTPLYSAKEPTASQGMCRI